MCPLKVYSTQKMVKFTALLLVAVAVMGCPMSPGGQTDYDLGFEDGFAEDAWYWDGYDDGWFSVDATSYYDDSEIPYLDSPPYDAGYWDGIWYAYNDGYFVDYHYAFIIGFSEGYDNAYWSDYLDFLDDDQHIEFRNGGWGDGYHDGYSEGRVFGANDYEQGLPFDWFDALLDYESGTDLYFEEVDVGTGIYGPVELYEYGANPNAKSAARSNRIRFDKAQPAIRDYGVPKAVDVDNRSIYRPLDSVAQNDLNVMPDESLRDATPLRLTTSWLDRVNTYLGTKVNSGQKSETSGSVTIRNRTKTAIP
ncbi:MAG: hypothetical protein AMXMBFR84_22590 [Candidatus Hydrogenedentota bacterium]